MQGTGIYTWKKGGQYDGMWFDNKMHGRGVFTTINGESTTVFMKNGKEV